MTTKMEAIAALDQVLRRAGMVPCTSAEAQILDNQERLAVALRYLVMRARP